MEEHNVAWLLFSGTGFRGDLKCTLPYRQGKRYSHLGQKQPFPQTTGEKHPLYLLFEI